MKKVMTILIGFLTFYSCTSKEDKAPYNGYLTGEIKYTGASNMAVDNVIITLSGTANNTEEISKRITSDGKYDLELPAGTYTMELKGNRCISNDLPFTVKIVADETRTKDINIEQLPSSMVILYNDIEYKSGENIALGSAMVLDIWNKHSSSNLNWNIRAYPQPSWITFEQVKGSVAGGGRKSVVFSVDKSMMPNIGDNYSDIIFTTDDNGSFTVRVSATNDGTLANVNTLDVKSIAASTATFNGVITNQGIPAYTERGFVYSMTSPPTIENTISKLTSAVTQTTNFSGNVSGLTLNETYYVRAYAINDVGVSYSTNEMPFTTTAILPKLSTQTASNISIANSAATFNGLIETNGDPAYTERGFVYGLTHSPTKESESHIVSGTGLGAFSHNATNLIPGNTYYIRAYADNAGGTTYGGEVALNFSAKLPNITTITVSNIDSNEAVLSSNIAYIGDPSYTERGFVYGTMQNPTVTNSTTIPVSGSGNDVFNTKISGLTEGVIYYVRSYATSSLKTAYSPQSSFIASPATHIIVLTGGIAVQRSDISSGDINWITANDLCTQSTIGGYSDWRLPTLSEMSVIHNYYKNNLIWGFSKDYLAYWTSVPCISGGTSDDAYFLIVIGTGNQRDASKHYSHDAWTNFRGRCVRTLP